jgi:hypothetical protein
MKQMTAVVENGQIVLPEAMPLPNGSIVQISWDEQMTATPLEKEPWTEEDLQADLDWANGKRFSA